MMFAVSLELFYKETRKIQERSKENAIMNQEKLEKTRISMKKQEL